MTQSIQGRTCVVTGATSGIGRAAAEELAGLGAHVVLVARDRDRGARAREEIATTTGNDSTKVELCDLASQGQIRNLADRLLKVCPEIHVLINNAGLTMARHTLTGHGLVRSPPWIGDTVRQPEW